MNRMELIYTRAGHEPEHINAHKVNIVHCPHKWKSPSVGRIIQTNSTIAFVLTQNAYGLQAAETEFKLKLEKKLFAKIIIFHIFFLRNQHKVGHDS